MGSQLYCNAVGPCGYTTSPARVVGAVGHFRTANADEVDLVLERDDGAVIAFEIKAGTRVHREDLRGVNALRARLGSRLETAVILYTGDFAYTHDDGTVVLPLDMLWK